MGWTPPAVGQLFGCQECPALVGAGVECVGVRTVDVSGLNEPSFGESLPAGLYVLRYCYGAFNYANQPGYYAVTRAPGSADQTWTNQAVTGHFLVANVQGQGYLTFGEAQPAGTGYGNHAAAESALRCRELRFKFAGGYIKLHFSDKLYTDNAVDNGQSAPTFGLYRITPRVEFVGATAGYWTDDYPTRTHMRGSYQFRCLTDARLLDEPIRLTLASAGGVTPTAPAYVDLTLDYNEVGNGTWNWSVSPSGNISADLHFGVGLQGVGATDAYGTFVVPLDPVVVISWYEDPVWPDSGTKRRVQLNVTNVGAGPTSFLECTVTPVNGTHLWDGNDWSVELGSFVWKPRLGYTGWPTQEGSLNGCGDVDLLLQVVSPGPNGRVQLTIAPADGGTSWPSFSVDLPGW